MTYVVNKTTSARASRGGRILLSSILASLLLSTQVLACINIKDNYSGSTTDIDKTAFGPFAIGSDCLNTLIQLTVKASGAGSPPDMYIEKYTEAGWKSVAGPTKTSTSYSEVGKTGTYRIWQRGGTGSSPLYTGTVTYGH